MRLLIVEDEPLGVETLVQFLREIDPSITVVGNTDSIQSSVQWLQENQLPDLVLMDIELSDGQSFEIFNRIEVRSPVIFTTSYDEYALKAFKVNSIDYLLKPIKKDDLKRALDKFKDLRSGNPAGAVFTNIEKLINDLSEKKTAGFRSRFLVKQGQRFISIETADIAYIFAENRVSYLVTWDRQKHYVDYSLEQIEAMLDPKFFFRANRGLIIQARAVVQIHNYFNGKLKLTLDPVYEAGDVIVSREKANGFKEWMGK